MKKHEKEVLQAHVTAEEQELKKLKAIYNKANQDIEDKLAQLLGRDDADMSQVIYQVEYQKALKKQIGSILDDLNTNQFTSITEYMDKCYKNGFVGAMYSLHNQNIPLLIPVDQKKVVNALRTDSKISQGLYEKLGEDVSLLKKRIANNLSRGVAAQESYTDIARNISMNTNVGMNNAMRIARTEGGRISNQAAYDAMIEAKAKGADVIKQWNASLDGNTRDSHRRVDGETRELDEKFSNGLMFPCDPNGMASEVINCRCKLQQRAKWAMDEEELAILKERAEILGVDKADSFKEFEKKYMKATDSVAKTVENSVKSNIIKSIDIEDFQIITRNGKITSEVSDVILKNIKATEKTGEMHISNVIVKSIANTEAGTPVMQIEPDQFGLLQLILNKDVLADKTVAEIDVLFAQSNKTLANSLEEAVKHENGHAKLVKGMTAEQIEKLYAELENIHIEGISEIAYSDGAECIAEVEILLSRGAEVPEKALKLYEKYIKR